MLCFTNKARDSYSYKKYTSAHAIRLAKIAYLIIQQVSISHTLHYTIIVVTVREDILRASNEKAIHTVKFMVKRKWEQRSAMVKCFEVSLYLISLG